MRTGAAKLTKKSDMRKKQSSILPIVIEIILRLASYLASRKKPKQ